MMMFIKFMRVVYVFPVVMKAYGCSIKLYICWELVVNLVFLCLRICHST